MPEQGWKSYEAVMQRYELAINVIKGEGKYTYYDIRGVAGNLRIRPVCLAPVYMTTEARAGFVLPIVDIFVYEKLVSPEDYDAYFERIFNGIPVNVQRAQSTIWGQSHMDGEFIEDELHTLVNAAQTNAPLGVALYSIEATKPVDPRNTLIGLYHMPGIRTSKVIETMRGATDNGLAHVRGISFQ